MTGETQQHSAAPQPQATPALQAVVVIHGMGEQRPMDTIKDFVHAVWETDGDITQNGLRNPARVWSKPDVRTGSLELRRITTRESIRSDEFPSGVRTDFYELYWADLTAGSTWDEFTNWTCNLLFRRPWKLPTSVRLAWVFLWVATLIVIAVAALTIVPSDWFKGIPMGLLLRALLASIAAFLLTRLHKFATATFGRVVRYTRADPDNIAARAAVRDRGLKLLTALHEGDKYKRIIVVAHSLGTILAHDLLSYFWAQRTAARTVKEMSPEFDALCDLEEAAEVARQAADPAALDRYSRAQRALRLLLAKRPAPKAQEPDRRWLISDLLTLGSPLTHAEILLASGAADLQNRKDTRELPESPPFREDLDKTVLQRAIATNQLPITDPPRLCSFPIPDTADEWELHHAAPFSVVRWTNIYDPARLVFFGDVIGGPLAPVFGPAIIDVNLKELRGRQSWSFSHTKYWQPNREMTHIWALRRALNLLDQQ